MALLGQEIPKRRKRINRILGRRNEARRCCLLPSALSAPAPVCGTAPVGRSILGRHDHAPFTGTAIWLRTVASNSSVDIDPNDAAMAIDSSGGITESNCIGRDCSSAESCARTANTLRTRAGGNEAITSAVALGLGVFSTAASDDRAARFVLPVEQDRTSSLPAFASVRIQNP